LFTVKGTMMGNRISDEDVVRIDTKAKELRR
jgi:hypothetical protein